MNENKKALRFRAAREFRDLSEAMPLAQKAAPPQRWPVGEMSGQKPLRQVDKSRLLFQTPVILSSGRSLDK